MSTPLTVKQVAKQLRKHPYTIQAWCRSGRLRAVRAGKDWMIAPDYLDALFGERKQVAGSNGNGK